MTTVAHQDTVRSVASDATECDSWVSSRKRDWDNAFVSKFHELESTLQENDRWLAIYWQNIAGMKDTKKLVAISEALKTSSSKRRTRARMDVRDVFTRGRSPGHTLAKRHSSFNNGHNTINMALAQMAMLPPKSPYLSNVVSSPQSATALASADTVVGELKSPLLPSLRVQRSESSISKLARSNSAAAKTAAAVRQLQMIARSPGREDRATVPTLRDILLNRQSPTNKPKAQSPTDIAQLQKTPPFSHIDMALGSLSLDAKRGQKSVGQPELPKEEEEEEDVHERLQRVRLALKGAGEPEEAEPEVEVQAASPTSTDADLEALCRDIDEVESMLPREAESRAPAAPEDPGPMFVDVEIDQSPIDITLDADKPHTSPGKRKYSSEESAKMPTRPRAGLPQTSIPRPRVPPRTDSRLGRVAETRRLFDTKAAPFASPVAAMRPGSSSIVQTPAQIKRLQGARPQRPVKSSAAVVREAARKAEAVVRKPEAVVRRADSVRKPETARRADSVRKPETVRRADSAVRKAEPVRKPETTRRADSVRRTEAARKPVGQPGRPEALFKSVGQKPSQGSLRVPPPSRLNGGKRPAPLALDSSNNSSGSEAIPTKNKAPFSNETAPKGKAPSSDSESKASSSDSGKWTGITSMLSVLSPSSWKTQDKAAAAVAAAASSPYGGAPQTPYQPRPEHKGTGQLVMPAFQDVAVPLRRSSGGSLHSSFFSDASEERAQSDIAAHEMEELEGFASQVTPMHRQSEYRSIIPAGSESPPEIESDYSDEYSDDEFTPRRKKNDFRIPRWATTPELARGLELQERVNPERIFGRVRPLRVNEIFNRRDSGEPRRKPRNSSMIWTGADALTADEELEYIRRMGFD